MTDLKRYGISVYDPVLGSIDLEGARVTLDEKDAELFYNCRNLRYSQAPVELKHALFRYFFVTDQKFFDVKRKSFLLGVAGEMSPDNYGLFDLDARHYDLGKTLYTAKMQNATSSRNSRRLINKDGTTRIKGMETVRVID
jgi:hypothetical protein